MDLALVGDDADSQWMMASAARAPPSTPWLSTLTEDEQRQAVSLLSRVLTQLVGEPQPRHRPSSAR